MNQYYSPRILLMKDGLECELLKLIITQVKHVKGLTSILSKEAGINGKWIKPEEPYNFSVKRFLRMIIFKVKYQEIEACMRDIREFLETIYQFLQEEEKKSQADSP